MALRVLLADDEVLLSAGLTRLLEDAGIEVVATVARADEVLEAVAEHRPDVAITDVQMPPTGTDDGLARRDRGPARVPGDGRARALELPGGALPADLIGEDAKGVGYLLKSRIGDVDSFLESVRRVADGGSALDPEVVQRMVSRRRRDSPIDDLTARERTVLAQMAEGKSNHGIAADLGVTPAAVEKHVTGVFNKLGLGDEPLQHRRVTAVLTMLRAS